MPLWLWAVEVVVVIIALTAVLLAALVVRRRYLARTRGTFDLSINKRAEASAHGWTLGVAVYDGGTLEWYRTFSFRLRPSYRFERASMWVEGRREPVGGEVHAIHDGHVVVSTQNETLFVPRSQSNFTVFGPCTVASGFVGGEKLQPCVVNSATGL